DELTDKGGALKFQTNTKFRSDMQTRLLKDSEPNILKNAVRWILLIFLLLALIQAFTKFNHVPAADSRPLYESLALTKPDQLVILLFHYEKRCEQCLNMEAFSKAYIKQHPEVELRLVNIAKTKQQSLVSHFNIVTSSIVIMRFRDKKPLHSSFVKELLDSYKDKERFIKELSLAIDSLGLDK
ncbi:MAG: hypothetical protein MJH11_21880, partial [Lentisphaeria bacterium]|nr:hypothetical protein [Lentisphaeria bacterium]